MANVFFTGDNLPVMESIDSECIDLIYLDPPFNTGKDWSGRSGVKFKDKWTAEDVDLEFMEYLAKKYPCLDAFISMIENMYGEAMHAYIVFITQRLLEMYRVLKSTGSIYLHIDPTASHYLKVVMDRIFGKDSFRNEIIWSYAKPRNTKHKFLAGHDVILFYAKGESAFNPQRVPRKTKYAKGYTRKRKDGTVWTPQDDKKLATDVWTDIGNAYHMPKKEKTGYPTQKPLALLERIIKASSNEGDVVLDPFCGSGTTIIAAQQLNRKWIGIDISANAVPIILKRINEYMFCDFVYYKHEA